MKSIEEFKNKIIHGDCLEVMKDIPDNSIDLVITDPPYGDNCSYGRENKEILNNEDEEINYRFINNIYPKMKDNTNLYLFTNWKFITKLRNYIENNTLFKIRIVLVIVKNNIGMGYSFRNQYELCIVMEKGNPKYNLNNFSNVLFMENINHDKDTHPHQKGIEILEKIIRHSSKKGDIIFDGFLGSGSIIEACIKQDRNYVGVELDNKWFNLINKRLDKWKSQTKLF